MDGLRIIGGKRLNGTVTISGAKNAALPIVCATLLSDGESILRNVPDLRDIDNAARLLEVLGRPVEPTPPQVTVYPGDVTPEAPYDIVKRMRASILVLGPLLARFGRAKVSLPGGCQIGTRPVDQHLKGLEALGAKIEIERGYIIAEAPKGLQGGEVVFDMPTVTGTENLMMAAALAKGRTTLVNCAREPEVIEVARVLNKMGAKVSGAGTAVIQIEGKSELAPFDHAIISDRIEAGTYLVAAAAVGGNVLVEKVPVEDLEVLIMKMRAAGAIVEREGTGLRVVRDKPLRSVDVRTSPHPGFPTDMQAQFMVMMTMATGTSRIAETIFENRFMHVPELARMGASIEVHGNTAMVGHVEKLYGTMVMATDLRASASLVIAGMMATEGETLVHRIYHLDRGYEHMENKLGALGADVVRVHGLGV
jgi:UDP-N-acetylglucosamine 1-carboxyvinyltransferase